jgi:hypothetical protein
MPKKKKSSSAPKGLSAQEIAALNKRGLQDAMTAVPLLKFEDMFKNFGMFSGGITDAFGDLFGGMIDRGERTTGMGPEPQAPQVGPDEWAQLMKQMQAPQQAPAPQPQPQQPVQGMPAGGAPYAGQPGMPQLTPQQLEQIRKAYPGGMI